MVIFNVLDTIMRSMAELLVALFIVGILNLFVFTSLIISFVRYNIKNENRTDNTDIQPESTPPKSN